jgi:hypothetical protein
VLRIGLADLPTVLTGVGDDVRDGPAGWCVKGVQPLVSRVCAPSLLLTGAAVHV